MIFSNFQLIVIFQIYPPWRDDEVARFSARLLICISLNNKVSVVFASFFKPFQQLARYSEVASLLFTHNTFLDFYSPVASYMIITYTC